MSAPDLRALDAAGTRLAATHAAIAQELRVSRTEPAREAGSQVAPGLLVQLANRALAPAAQSHPWVLVSGAALLGAALTTRPWRHAIGTVLMAAVLTPAAGSWALRQATHALTQPRPRPSPQPSLRPDMR